MLLLLENTRPRRDGHRRLTCVANIRLPAGADHSNRLYVMVIQSKTGMLHEAFGWVARTVLKCETVHIELRGMACYCVLGRQYCTIVIVLVNTQHCCAVLYFIQFIVILCIVMKLEVGSNY